MRAGLPQLLIVLALVLLFFGARRLPDLAESLGRSLRSFRRSMDADDDEDGDGSAATDVSPRDGSSPERES